MERLGFLYDTTRCVGCKACQVACKEENHLGVGDFFRRVETVETAKQRIHFSGACNHCADPACVAVCPTGAMYVAADGTVQHDDEQCVGCGRCVHHCPYGSPSLNKVTGYAQKCTACASRRQQGLYPACVAACPTRALAFDPLEPAASEDHVTSSDALPFLPPASITAPSLLLRQRAGAAVPPVTIAPPAQAASHQSLVRRDTQERFLILGGGAAAVSAARAIRERNATGEICLISRERRAPYCRPMLSKGLLGSFSADRYPIVSDGWLAEQNVQLRTGQAVAALNTTAKTVTLDNGETLCYNKCVYALGADCFVPPIPGHEKPGVFTLRNEADLYAIRRQMLTAAHAVVIGGGITGLEFAWEMKKYGLAVTVLEMAPMLMGRLLDRRSAQTLRTAVEAVGIAVVTDIRIRGLEGEAAVKGVTLEDGRAFPAELVLLSTGFRASIAVARAAGLAVDRAIAVSPAMETSAADVFACGDCTDLSQSTWMQSIRQGEVAGANAAGDHLAFQAVPEPAMVHTAGTSLLCVGDMGKKSDTAYRLTYGHSGGAPGRYFVNPRQPRRQETEFALCFAGDELVGATLIGDLGEMRFVQEAVERRQKKALFLEAAAKKGVVLYDA